MQLTDIDVKTLRLAAQLLASTAPAVSEGLEAILKREPAAPEASPLADFIAGLPLSAEWGQRAVPKIIWQFWHSGLETAPDVVKRSYQTWKDFNPDHDVLFLSLADANEVLGLDLEEIFARMTVDLGWAGKADLIRIMLLAKFGGIWADATTFCLAPLSDWMHPGLEENGFFCFRHPRRLTDHELVLWFMAASPGHPFMTQLLNRAAKYLFMPRAQKLGLMKRNAVWQNFPMNPGDRPGARILDRCEREAGAAPYFWLFYLFKSVLDRNPQEREALRKKSNEHAQEPHPESRFLTAHVSKQTYKNANVEIRKRRIKMLFRHGKLQMDFRARALAASSAPAIAATKNPKKPAPKPQDKVPGKQWWEVRKSFAISEARKVIFIHIPKCGGTSVDQSALFEGGIRRWGHDTLNNYRRILGPRFAEFRVLTLVRNPWDRLASAFHFASIEAPTYKNADAKVARDLMAPFDNDLSRFLPVFCDAPEPYLKALWFRPGVRFFDPKRCEVPYFIQKLEEIEDLSALNAFVGMTGLELGHHRKGPVKPRGASLFSKAIFDRVGEIYADDIAAFDYAGTTMDQLKY